MHVYNLAHGCTMCNELLTFVTFDGIQKSANYKERQDTPTRAQITKRGTWHTSSAPAKGHKWPSRSSQNTEGAASASFAQKTILLIWFNLLWLIQKTRYTWCEGGTEAIGSMKHVKCTSNESHIPQHTLKSSEGMASTCFDGMQVKIARVKSARRTSSYAWLYIVN